MPEQISEDEVRDEFDRFGKIESVIVREGKGGGTSFCFIKYTTRDDAVEAMRRTDQAKMFGMPFVKVSWSSRSNNNKGNNRPQRPRSRSRQRSRSGGWQQRRPRSQERRPRSPEPKGRWNDDWNRSGSRGRHPPTPPRRRPPSPPARNGGGGDDRRSRSPRRDQRPGYTKPAESQGAYRVKLERLPPDMGWQELKEVAAGFAKRGQCTFTRTNRDLTGILEYTHRDDMDRAIDELNGRRFQGCRERMVAYQEHRRD